MSTAVFCSQCSAADDGRAACRAARSAEESGASGVVPVFEFPGDALSRCCLAPAAEFPFEADGEMWPTVLHYCRARDVAASRRASGVGDGLAPRLPDAVRDRSADRAMSFALRARFRQHPSLQRTLLSTGGAMLVSRDDLDDYWSDGRAGRGANMLGRILMQLRDESRLQGFVDAWPRIAPPFEGQFILFRHGTCVTTRRDDREARALAIELLRRLRRRSVPSAAEAGFTVRHVDDPPGWWIQCGHEDVLQWWNRDECPDGQVSSLVVSAFHRFVVDAEDPVVAASLATTRSTHASDPLDDWLAESRSMLAIIERWLSVPDTALWGRVAACKLFGADPHGSDVGRWCRRDEDRSDEACAARLGLNPRTFESAWSLVRAALSTRLG